MKDPVDLKAERAKRDDEHERAEIRRKGFASSNPALQELSFSSVCLRMMGIGAAP